MSAQDCAGHFERGWSGFYESKVDLDQGKPQLRTYQPAEKFYETFKEPHVPPRPGKSLVPPVRDASLTWGVGGTLPQGKKYLPVPPAADFKLSQKKFLQPAESGHAGVSSDLGRKGHVYDGAGVDQRTKVSEGFTLEDVLQRKGRVTEEMRSEQREIHRVAPPGLKGYMGAEYSNNFFTTGRDLGLVGPKAVERPTRKTFKQKRVEEEIAEQVALVSRLQQPLELAAGEVDSDDEEAVAAAAAAAAAPAVADADAEPATG
jgi:hypothetical protein